VELEQVLLLLLLLMLLLMLLLLQCEAGRRHFRQSRDWA
jgi:hypothetical protein